MKIVTVKDNQTITIGRVGENKAKQIIWKGLLGEWRELYGEGIVQLAVRRPKDSAPYPATCEMSGDDVIWTVSSADVAFLGIGECELSYLVDDIVAKSKTWLLRISRSLTGDNVTKPPEDPAKSWFVGMQSQIGDLNKLTTKAKDNLVSAINEVKEDIVQPDWNQNDPSAKDYVKNRTHWTETVTKTVISKQTVTTELNNDKNVALLSISDEQLVILKDAYDTEEAPTFSVVFDDVKYSLRWFETNGNRLPILGNFSLIQPDAPDTGEPFVLSINVNETTAGIALRTAETCTLSVDATYSFAHRLPMQYSPVIIQDEDFPLREVQKLVMSWSLSRVLTVDYDENKKQLTLGANTDAPVLTYYAVPAGQGYQWSSDAVGKSWSFQVTPSYDLRQYIGNNKYGCSVLFREFMIDDDKYDVWLQLCVNGLTGSFVTLTGAVYTVCINFNATSVDTRFDQKWTMTIRRIH